MAAALLERKEAEGFADAAEGDVEGVVIGGGVEEAVQTGVEQVQAVQHGGLVDLVLAAALDLEGAGEMLAVAAEGRGAEAVLPGQGAVGRCGQQTLVDLPALGVVADGTAFDHTCAPKQEFPQDAGWVSGYQGRRWRARTGGTGDGKREMMQKMKGTINEFAKVNLSISIFRDQSCGYLKQYYIFEF